MCNINSALLGSGWYDACEAPTVEYAYGGKELSEDLSIESVMGCYLIKPDKSYEGALLSHYGKDISFEDIFDAENIPIEQTDISNYKVTKLFNNNSLNIFKNNGQISFVSPQNGNYSVSIFSIYGQKIKENRSNTCTKGKNV